MGLLFLFTFKYDRPMIMHSCIFSSNLQIKGTFTAKRGQENFNPFSKGSLLKNCMGVLCGPAPPR